MTPHPGPPANVAGGPPPSGEALGGAEEAPLASAGGFRPSAQAGGHPPSANALGGLGEVSPRYQGVDGSGVSNLRKRAREESGVMRSAAGVSAGSEPRPVRRKQPIAYLHESAYYADPSPSSHCYQRQHQGELCPDSHGCSNSIHNIHTTSREASGEMGMGLVAQRDILTDEVIAVFGDAAILQEQGLTMEFADLINTYNSKHPTRGFQYSIFKNVAGDTHQSVVIPDHDRVLALEVGNICNDSKPSRNGGGQDIHGSSKHRHLVWGDISWHFPGSGHSHNPNRSVQHGRSQVAPAVPSLQLSGEHQDGATERKTHPGKYG